MYSSIPSIIIKSQRGIQGVDISSNLFTEHRIIYFNDEVNSRTAGELNIQLMGLDSLNHNEITLFINSPGGDVDSGLSVYDMIRNGISSPVRTVCAGNAASMGFILFLAGEKRLMFRNSRLMLHDPSMNGGGLAGLKPLELKNEVLDRLLQVRSQLGKIISERSGLSVDEVLKLTEKDTYLSADESVIKGFATQIIDNSHALM